MLAKYYELVISTESRINTYLPDDAEWYIVNMLCYRKDLEQFPVMAYTQLATSSDIICDLRRLADSGLIMPSMFPDRCKHLNIDFGWYYGVSRSCFEELYQRLSEPIYRSILKNFT